MGIKVSVLILPEHRSTTVELEIGLVRELIHRLGYATEGVIVIKNGRPLLEDEQLEDGDNVTVYRAASGG